MMWGVESEEKLVADHLVQQQTHLNFKSLFLLNSTSLAKHKNHCYVHKLHAVSFQVSFLTAEQLFFVQEHIY